MSQMSDEKKARLEAIRAANRAKKAPEGDAAPEPTAPATTTTEAPTATATMVAPAAPAAVGVSMSDEKKAKLEAIRAANAAKKAAAGQAPATTTAAPATAQAATPAVPATKAAAPAAKPATRGVTVPQPVKPIEDDPQPWSVLIKHAAIGAVVGVILCVLLATMTGNYLMGAFWGLILGAVGGLLVLSWPPQHTTGD
jgi:hypothetical protein